MISEIQNVLEICRSKCAVIYWDDQYVCKKLSYEEVNQISNKITRIIRTVVKEKHVCVGLYMEHSPYIPSLVISLFKCELTFIFLDPYAPATSNLGTIKQLNLKWVISINGENYNDFLSTYLSEKADLDGSVLKLWEVNSPSSSVHSFETICYVVCTSGTTGDPKIVKVQTECISSNILSLRNSFKLTADDIVFFGTPLTFDPSMVELLLALTSGSSLLIAPRKTRRNPTHLLKILFPEDKSSHKGTTVLQIVPSLFLRWNRLDIEFILLRSTCRILAFGGEKFPEEILHFKKSEHLRIFNLYGITEVSCWASVCEVTNVDKGVPLGLPLGDTILDVRDDAGSSVTDGEGDLYIGSCSRICFINEENQSVLTKPVFRSTGDRVRVNSKGIFYICRNNNTIKRFGCKVNISQVEDDIFKQTNLPNICVWLEDKKKFVVFIAVKEHNLITKQKIIDKLRIKLLHSLPKQCFPDHIEIVPNFPLTKHGKIDKQSLAEIYLKSDTPYSFKDAPSLFEFLWGKYLALSFGEVIKYYNCNFFEAGGNSVSAIQFLSEFRDTIGIDYPNDLTTFLFERTLKECLDCISNFRAVPAKKRKYNTEKCDKECTIDSQTAAIANRIRVEIHWKYNLDACVDSPPTIINRMNLNMVAIGSFSHSFAILDSENGNIISQIVLPDAIESASCISRTSGQAFIGCYDGKMYSIEILTGKIIWEYSTRDRIKSTPCLCLQNQAVAFGSYDKYVHCIKIEDGTQIWKTLISESVTSNLIYYKEKLLVATTFGTCLCLSESSGEVQWKCSIGSPIFGSGCLCSSKIDSIIWPDVSGILHSLSCASGEKQWTFKANGNIYSSLTSYGKLIIFGCHDHNIYCVRIDEDGCSLMYKVPLESAISPTPCVMRSKDDTYIIAPSNQGNIYVIELGTGNIIGNVRLPGEIFSSPVTEANCIYVGCRDNNVYCLRIVND